MKDFNDNTPCSRTDDLLSVLYGEATEREASDFRAHMQTCRTCETEMHAFGGVRESIGAWKFEALSVAPAPEVSTSTHRVNTKSAIAALREFFDLSPLWLKGATALAAVTFCVLAGLALFKTNNNQVISKNPDAVYTQQDVNQAVKEALAQQARVQPPVETPSPENVAVNPAKPKPKSPRASSSTQFARTQRPLSKEERNQLAAELRLLSSADDATLTLLGDRINQ